MFIPYPSKSRFYCVTKSTAKEYRSYGSFPRGAQPWLHRHDEAEKSFCVAGKEITAKLLAEALRSLPEEKRDAVLLYYFFDMSDVEIGKLRDVPRSTVQYRRTSSFELLKRYLEERAYDTSDW